MPNTAGRSDYPNKLNDVGPVARVWVVCQTMPSAKRAEVLTACQKLGINRNTASTQYQLWKYSRRQADVARHLPPTVRGKIQRAVGIVVHVEPEVKRGRPRLHPEAEVKRRRRA